MAKITLDDTVSGYNLQIINNNFDKLETELQGKVLYRDNPVGEPNQMESPLDMNGNRITNLPAPISPSEAARLQDVNDALAGGSTAVLTDFDPYLTITSTNVQGAVEQVKDEVDALDNKVDNLVFNTETYTRNSIQTSVIDSSVDVIITAGYASIGDGGEAKYVRRATEPSHPGKVQSADGAWWELNVDVINVKQLGAVADSTGIGTGTDASPAISNALQVAIAQSKNLYIPEGNYRLNTPITYNKQSFNGDFGFVPNIIGAGTAMTRLFCTQDGIAVYGDYTTGYSGFFKIADLALWGNQVGAGLNINVSAFVELDRVKSSNFEVGVRMRGVISSKLNMPYLSNNKVGFLSTKETGADYPGNAITIDQPWIASNTRAGIIVDYPATFNIRGGSVEGNGSNQSISVNQRGGIILNNPGEGGHNAIASTGVYYEYNSGVADVLIYGSSRTFSASFDGNSFTRMGTNYTTHCILATAATHDVAISLFGNGFGELGTGINPLPTETYVKWDSGTGTYTFTDLGNSYQKQSVRPNYALTRAVASNSAPFAMGFCFGDGTLDGGAINVQQVVKLGTGQYRVVFARGFSGRKFAHLSITHLGFAMVNSHDGGSLDFTLFNTSGTPVDAECGFTIYCTEPF